jgi:hypothetical protein
VVDGELAKLMANFPRRGKWWIGIRLEQRAPLAALDRVDAVAGYGLAGDHYASKNNANRQVTLIQAEHLEAVAKLLGKPEVRPEWVRRNILVAGINLMHYVTSVSALAIRCWKAPVPATRVRGWKRRWEWVTTPCGGTAASSRASSMVE